MLNEWRLALYMFSVGVNMRVLTVLKTILSSPRQAVNKATRYWIPSSAASHYDVISEIVSVCSTVCDRTKLLYGLVRIPDMARLMADPLTFNPVWHPRMPAGLKPPSLQ